MLVGPKLEVGERVRAVLPHELACRPAHLGVGEIAWRGQGPEDEIRSNTQGGQSEQPDGHIEPAERTVERDRAVLPEEQVAGLPAERRGRSTRRRGNPDEQERNRNAGQEDERNPHEPRRQWQRLVADVERAPPDEEE